jgi:hypothetical protein
MPRPSWTALKLEPDNALLLNFLGYGKLERGEDLDAAEAMIRKASALSPTMRRSPTRWAGHCSSADGLPSGSRRCAGRRRPIPPSRRSMSIWRCAVRLGRRIEARFSWQAALITAGGQGQVAARSKMEAGLTAPPPPP